MLTIQHAMSVKLSDVECKGVWGRSPPERLQKSKQTVQTDRQDADRQGLVRQGPDREQGDRIQGERGQGDDRRILGRQRTGRQGRGRDRQQADRQTERICRALHMLTGKCV